MTKRSSVARRMAERMFETVTGKIVLAITALTVIIGAYVKVNAWVAKAEDLQKVDERVTLVDARLDEWKTSDDLAKTQQRLWRYQDRYGKECEKADQVVRDECRTLREQWKRLEEKLKQYEPKK